MAALRVLERAEGVRNRGGTCQASNGCEEYRQGGAGGSRVAARAWRRRAR